MTWILQLEALCWAGTTSVRPVLCAQDTAFGAVFDVMIDIVSRGVVWTWAVPGPLGVLPPLLEAFTFVCTHSVSTHNFPMSGLGPTFCCWSVMPHAF